MKIETTTKTYDIDGVTFVISTNGEDFTVIAGYKDSISLEEDYDSYKDMPQRYQTLWGLKLNETLGSQIKCTEVEEDIFNF